MSSVFTGVVMEINETMEMRVQWKLKMGLKQNDKLVMNLNGELGKGSRGFVV